MENNECNCGEKCKCKKSHTLLITLLACLITGGAVFYVTNSMKKETKCDTKETKEDSNKTSNEESNVTSNIESNSNSNVTSNEPTQPTTANYKLANVVGTYSAETKDSSYSMELLDNGLFSITSTPKGPACSFSKEGNYYVENDKIVFNSILMSGCGTAHQISISKSVGTFNGKTITLDKVTYTVSKDKSKTNNKEYIQYLYDSVGRGYAENHKSTDGEKIKISILIFLLYFNKC